MIDNSVLKRLAIQQFGTILVQGKEYFELDEEGLQAFEQAIIENYKAGLVPAAWLDEDTIVSFGHLKYGFIDQKDRAIPNKWHPLYALPSGETK